MSRTTAETLKPTCAGSSIVTFGNSTSYVAWQVRPGATLPGIGSCRLARAFKKPLLPSVLVQVVLKLWILRHNEFFQGGGIGNGGPPSQGMAPVLATSLRRTLP